MIDWPLFTPGSDSYTYIKLGLPFLFFIRVLTILSFFFTFSLHSQSVSYFCSSHIRSLRLNQNSVLRTISLSHKLFQRASLPLLSSHLLVTLAQAIAYLTRPLTLTHPAVTIVRLQFVLEANLIALLAPTWVSKEPLRGSARRRLTLSPTCLPPRAVYAACLASGVQWFDWIAALGGREFDLFVDPGCISVQFGKGAKLVTIWSEELTVEDTCIPHLTLSSQLPLNSSNSKTLAQQLLESDHTEDEELFALIADQVRAPVWMTPVVDRFPAPARSESPLSVISTDSCSSYRSSDSGSCFSTTTTSTLSSKSDKSSCKLSRRERARQARVYVDTSKTAVTPYDGGKTTVLTGGVMLGAGPCKVKSDGSAAWRRM